MTEVRPAREEDREALLAMQRQSFNYPAHGLERLRRTPMEHQRVVADERGRLVGGLLAEPVGQFWGGRSLPASAVSAVRMAPEARGKGYGGLLMREELAEQRRRGVPLSVLYPSVPTTYQRSGYGLAGAHVRYRTPTPHSVPGELAEVEPWEDGDLPEVMELYARVLRSQNGALDRTEAWWHGRTLFPSYGQELYRYAVRDGGRLTGYVIYQLEAEPGDLPYFHSLLCRDLVWEDERAARTLLGLASAHRLLGTHLRWSGPPAEPLFWLTAGEEVRSEWSYVWMLRLVDVRAALAGRGYPDGVEAAVELDVADPVLPENAGPLRLEVARGSGRAGESAGGGARLDVSTLASLYSGWLAPREALRLGLLDGAGEPELRALERIFAGPTPWLVEQF